MIRLCLALVVLLLGIGFLPAVAAADARHGTADRTPPAVELVLQAEAVEHAQARDPHDHMPGTHGCRYAAGCSGVGSADIRTPSVPLPRQVAEPLHVAAAHTPRSVDLPLEDRPPRHV